MTLEAVVSAEAEAAEDSVAVLLPQAASEQSMVAASRAEMIFFFIFIFLLCSFPGQRDQEMRLSPILASFIPTACSTCTMAMRMALVMNMMVV